MDGWMEEDAESVRACVGRRAVASYVICETDAAGATGGEVCMVGERGQGSHVRGVASVGHMSCAVIERSVSIDHDLIT